MKFSIIPVFKILEYKLCVYIYKKYVSFITFILFVCLVECKKI